MRSQPKNPYEQTTLVSPKLGCLIIYRTEHELVIVFRHLQVQKNKRHDRIKRKTEKKSFSSPLN